LEWAAEVTSAVDLEELQKQQQVADQQSLLHEAQQQQAQEQAQAQAYAQHQQSAPPVAQAPSHTPSHVQQRMQASYGQESASAAVVTSAGVGLAQSSLMDEDEDIPTVVAQPRMPESAQPGGPRPAAGSPAWDGMSTQMMPEGQQGGFDSTIALPDHDQANQIRQRVDEMDRQLAARPPPHQQQHQQQQHHQQQQMAHGHPQQQAPQQSQSQGAIETKMSLPRPAAVAQWLMEQGDVEIQGPRSTGVIIAIAALATLCVMGVASLIVYKLRLPPQPDPSAYSAPTVTAPVEVDPNMSPEAPAGSSKSGKDGKASSAGKGRAGDAPAAGKGSDSGKDEGGPEPGRLTINCRPACDSIVAGGQSLGPSPVFSHPMPEGTHRVTLKGNGTTKTIVVQIASGQLTTQTVPMK
jgi:hypothetical protein